MQNKGVKFVLVFIFAFLFGILVSSFINISPLVAVFIIILALGIYGVEKIWNKKVSEVVLMIICILLALSLAIIRYDIKVFHTGSEYLKSNIGKQVTFVGKVSDEVERRDADTRLVVDTGEDKVLVSTDMYADVKYGAQVEVSGVLKVPGIIEEEGRSFNYQKFLSKDDIYYTVSFAHIVVESTLPALGIKSILLSIKHSFQDQMREILPEPESSLLAGLIVSGKDALPKDITEEFRRAGIVHIVVLSGYNITIIAEFIRRLLRFMTPRKAAVGSVIGILLFVLMTGATATVVRAALMAVTAIGGKLFGRRYSAPRALLLAAFLMLLINPKILVFDPSFQLSFLATLALIYVVPVVDTYFQMIPEKFGLRTLISTTVATQILVLPYLLYTMGNISIISLLTNVLVLPVIPLTMLIGFVSVSLSFISTYIALPLTYITHILLAWILKVAEYCSNLPFAQIQISHVSIWLTLLIYVAIITLLWRSSLLRTASSDSQKKLQHS